VAVPGVPLISMPSAWPGRAAVVACSVASAPPGPPAPAGRRRQQLRRISGAVTGNAVEPDGRPRADGQRHAARPLEAARADPQRLHFARQVVQAAQLRHQARPGTDAGDAQ
jgi:hypothetical protein